jgi:adenylate cyclase
LIDRIAAYEPAAIGLEAFFPEPDRLSPDRFAVSLEQRSPELAAQLRSYPSNDSILAHAILRHHVVLPVAGLRRPSPNLESFAHFPAKHEVLYSPRNLPLIRYVGVLQTIDEIQEAAAGRGLASVELGSDNVLRNVPLIVLIGDIPVATFTLELLRVATNSTINAVQSSEGIVDVQLGSRAVAKAQANGEMRIRFGHRMEGLFISAADVLAGRVDRARLNGKMVVVGVTALGLAGQITTPLGVQMPGGEIYAIIEFSTTLRYIELSVRGTGRP